MPKASTDTALLDTTYKVETPEAIDLSAQLAGPVPRALAFSADLLLRSIVLSILFIILAIGGKAGVGIFLIVSFVLEWFYPVLFEVLYKGQTPGKRWMNIAVVNDDLTPVSWSTSIIRNLLRAVDFLPLCYVFGFFTMVMTNCFQRLGDIAAGSVVVHRQKTLPLATTLPKVTPTPPSFDLGLDDVVAFTGFVERDAALTTARKQELADMLSGVTQKTGPEAVSFIQGIGCWLLGERK
ncbi:RDD family protein [Teredinibacter waterburyi]|uniref:RDD family protein n=1 Tax=Teredinibacter waterburyi TaxID=1500538 RepID=UPI00165EF2E9|nr:RDD family protein [Teredinibacter waterburyi]